MAGESTPCHTALISLSLSALSHDPCSQQDKGESGNLSVEEVASDLRPLMLWMANSMELLNLVQKRVLDIEKDLDLEGEPRNLYSGKQRHLHSPRTTSELELENIVLGDFNL